MNLNTITEFLSDLNVQHCYCDVERCHWKVEWWTALIISSGCDINVEYNQEGIWNVNQAFNPGFKSKCTAFSLMNLLRSERWPCWSGLISVELLTPSLCNISVRVASLFREWSSTDSLQEETWLEFISSSCAGCFSGFPFVIFPSFAFQSQSEVSPPSQR